MHERRSHLISVGPQTASRIFPFGQAAGVRADREPRASARGSTTPTRFQLSSVEEAGDSSQLLGCNVDQKEGGFDAEALRELLIWSRHSGNQLRLARDLEKERVWVSSDEAEITALAFELFSKRLTEVDRCLRRAREQRRGPLRLVAATIRRPARWAS